MDGKHFADAPTPPAPDEEARIAAEATVMLVQIFDRMEEARPEAFQLLRTIASRATTANTATNPQAPVGLTTAGQGARTRTRRGPRSSKPCGLCSSQKLRVCILVPHRFHARILSLQFVIVFLRSPSAPSFRGTRISVNAASVRAIANAPNTRSTF